MKAFPFSESWFVTFSCSIWPDMYWFGSSSRKRMFTSGLTSTFFSMPFSPCTSVVRTCFATHLPIAFVLGLMQARTMSDWYSFPFHE